MLNEFTVINFYSKSTVKSMNQSGKYETQKGLLNQHSYLKRFIPAILLLVRQLIRVAHHGRQLSVHKILLSPLHMRAIIPPKPPITGKERYWDGTDADRRTGHFFGKITAQVPVEVTV